MDEVAKLTKTQKAALAAWPVKVLSVDASMVHIYETVFEQAVTIND